MRRLYFISADIKIIESAENRFIDKGVSRDHLHVLSNDDTYADTHGLNPVPSLFKNDGIHLLLRGFLIGLVLAVAVIIAAHLLGFRGATELMPFVFLAIILLGFCSWEGGMIGVHRDNYKFSNFSKRVNSGEHVLMVDAPRERAKQIVEFGKQKLGLEYLGANSSIINPLESFEAFSKA